VAEINNNNNSNNDNVNVSFFSFIYDVMHYKIEKFSCVAY